MICPHCLRREAVRVVCIACVVESLAEADADLDYQPHPLPPAPTSTQPGGLARRLVLQSRAARGWALWHPDDARLDWSQRWRDQMPAFIRHRLVLDVA